jgi:hypothetical protein
MKHGISVFLPVTQPGNLSPMLVGFRHILQPLFIHETPSFLMRESQSLINASGSSDFESVLAAAYGLP